MKKLLALMLLLMISLAFVACGSGDSGSTGDNGDNNGDNGGADTEPEKITYTVKWVDENGNELSSTKVEEGKKPSYSYSVTDTVEWDYTFEGWATSADGQVLGSLPVCNVDATYYAIVSKVKQKYTVTFNSDGGTTVDSQTVEYGATATEPVAPTYEQHRFLGWCKDAEGNTPVDFTAPITGNVEYFAIWNEVVDVKALLASLLEGYSVNPYSFIPDTMLPGYSANLVDPDELVTDYSGFVNVNDINCGFGEQWNMIVENLAQSKTFFNVLSVVESISAASVTAFNNYFDSNPADTANHTFAHGIYNITIDFDGEVLTYVVEYTANIPLLGTQTVQLALSTALGETSKTVRAQIGDANALAYKVDTDSYEFAIKYAGVRRAMFSVSRDDDGTVAGHIYEFLGVDTAQIKSAADFIITDDYVSVVGNKASGMLAFTGYINELYDVTSGELLGYEVQEIDAVVGQIVYDTLWFNLKDISGINSIKYREAIDKDNPECFYVNGSSTAWQAMKYGGINLKTASRRFDIEFRTQYVYSYDAANDEYTKHEIKVPMIFVQEEKYESFSADVLSTNKVSVSVGVSSVDLTKLLNDYDVMIPIFITNKEKVTPDSIVAYIGEKVTFE